MLPHSIARHIDAGRQRILSGWAISAFLIGIFVSYNYAQKPNSLAGQNIQLQDNITTEQAKLGYEKLLATLKEEGKKYETEKCAFLGIQAYQCIADSRISRGPDGTIIMVSNMGGTKYYLAPFPLALPYKVYAGIPRPVFSWAPVIGRRH